MVITCYDETNKDARAVNLTTQVGTITIVPVSFSYPAGSFRVESNLVFTHFTASVTAASGNHVFKITGFTAINEKVIEYYYQLDYLKDYWFRYSSNKAIAMENTLINSVYPKPINPSPAYCPFQVDTKVTNVAENCTETLGTVLSNVSPFLVMAVACPFDTSAPAYVQYSVRAALNSLTSRLSPKAIYYFYTGNNISAIDAVDYLIKLCFTKDATDSDPDHAGLFLGFYSNVCKAFYAPIVTTLPDYSSIFIPITGGSSDPKFIPYYKADGNDGTVDFQAYNLGYTKLPIGTAQNPKSGIIEVDQDTGIELTISNANDLPPYKTYNLFIPFIGWYTLPIADIFPTGHFGTGHLYVKYYYDLINGQVACSFGVNINGSLKYSNFKSSFVPLPSIELPTTNYPWAQSASDINYNNQALNSGINAVAGMIGATALGGPAAGIGIGASMLTKVFVDKKAYDRQKELNKEMSFNNGTDSSVGYVDRQFKLRVTDYYCSLSYNDAVKLYGYPIHEYSSSIDFSGEHSKYWINTEDSKLIGPREYTDAVRTEFASDYICYEPTSP